MTAQFYRPKKEDTGRTRLLYATVLVIFIFVLDIVAGGRLRGVVRTAGTYVWQTVDYSFSLFIESGIFATKHALEAKNQKLEEELEQYRQKDNAYNAMRDENEVLRAFANLATSTDGLTVPVVSSFEASPYGTFAIAAGINDGVGRGFIARTSDGFAVGEVVESDSTTALVKEFFAPNEVIQVVIGDAEIALEGQGGGNARAKAPRDIEIKVGDIVRSPRVASSPVGIVGKVESDPAAAYTQVFVRFPTNLQTMTHVYVGK